MKTYKTLLKAARRANAEAAVSLAQTRTWHGSTPMLREHFSSLTNASIVLRAVWTDQIRALAPGVGLLGELFNVQDSNDAEENTLGIGGMGDVPEYKGTIEYDSFEPLFPARYIHKEYAKGIAIERKLIDDEKYGVIQDKVQRRGMEFDRTIEKHAASIFNNAFSSSYVGGDAVALVSDSHPYSPTDAGTQDNKGALPLTHENVIATRIAMQRFKDSGGEILTVVPDRLVVPIELVPTAQVIVDSLQKSGTANNDTNVNRVYQISTSPFLTDPNDWFLVDTRLAKMFLRWYWRVRPEWKTDPTSDFNLMLRFRGYMRYSFGWDHWAWIYGHQVA